jgi:exodeoxyribonuclease VII large subunit
LRQVVAAERARLARTAARLSLTPIRHRTGEGERRLGELGERLNAGFDRLVAERDTRLRATTALLESYSYKGVLERGFALVTDADRHPVTAAEALKPGQPVTLEFHDGPVGAVIDGGSPARPRKPDSGAGRGAQPSPKPASRPRQGVLF